MDLRRIRYVATAALFTLLITSCTSDGDSGGSSTPASANPMPTPLPTTVTTLPTLGSIDRPIPRGAAGIWNEWELTLLGVSPDAAAAVRAENQFNKPPAAGFQFFMARLRVKRVAPGSDTFAAGVILAALGKSGRTYQSFSDSCGVIPDGLKYNELFQGGSLEGNWCVSVMTADATGLKLIVGSQNEQRVFMEL